MTGSSRSPIPGSPQPLIVYVTCKKCSSYRVACTSPLEVNVAVKSHVDTAHPAEASRLNALDAKSKKQLEAYNKTTQDMNKILELLLNFEQGHIVTPNSGGGTILPIHS